jgi:twinkle protein
MLTRVNAFAKANDVHVWFVAHPAKMQREGNELPVPDGMSISGSMAWWAKADVGLTVHRQENDVLIKVWKCRWRWIGKLGKTTLMYDVPSGTYNQMPF